MILTTRRELVRAVRDRYWRASRKQRTLILDEFVANTGYHRKYAVALLGRRQRNGATAHLSPLRTAGGRRRRRMYTQEVTDALVFIWKACDCIGSKRLHPFLPEMVRVLERTGELCLPDQTKQLLLTMSRATMDRLLKSAPGMTGTTPSLAFSKLTWLPIPLRVQRASIWRH